ncbi:MAG TPA: hypothetical protein VHF05_03370 [Candidatus Paceibacterota bacterium]|nr:hypothetical protein [Candidatus Paceibacterota bacterium]
MKKLIIALIVIAAVVGGVAYYRHATGGNNVVDMQATVSGTVKYVAPQAGTVTIETTDNSETSIAVTSSTTISDETGAAISLNDLQAGMSIQATGVRTPTSIVADTVRIVSRPPQGTDIAAPCPGVVTEDDNSLSCSMPITSRSTVSLPSADYSKNDLRIDPAASMGETFGASTGPDRWVRTFEATQPGAVTITVPAGNSSATAFKVSINVYGEPISNQPDNSAASDSNESGASGGSIDTQSGVQLEQ